MAILFKRFKTGDSLHKAVNQENFDKVYNILEDTEGEGCEIDRANANGKGWKIKVPVPMGDAEEDARNSTSASIVKRHDEELNQDIFSLKGFADEEASEPEDIDGITLLARYIPGEGNGEGQGEDDGGSAELVYLKPQTAIPVDTDGRTEDGGESEVTSKSVDWNEDGQLALHGIGEIEPKESFSDEERETAALVYVDTSDIPEVKYASLDAVISTDSESESPETQSVEKDDEGRLRLYGFTSSGHTVLPSNRSDRGSYGVLVRDENGTPYLDYATLDSLVLCDADDTSPQSKSVTQNGAVTLYDFFSSAKTSMAKSLRDAVALVLRDNSSSPPKLIYAKLSAAFPTDTEGSSTKSVARNSNGELELYNFTNASGGKIDRDNKDDYYVFCRQTGGTRLLQRTIDLPGADCHTGSLTVVTDVKYSTSTHRLEYTKQTLTFEKGLLKSVGEASDVLIDQAVEETV